MNSDVLLSDGTIARIRPLTTIDADALRAMLDRVSDESMYLRFFGAGRANGEACLQRLLAPGYEGLALAALAGDTVIGIGEFIPENPGSSAEVAFLVDEGRHHAGIATLLLEYLAAAAHPRGIRRFSAVVLAQNSSMLRVFTNAGFRMSSENEFGSIEVELDLTTTPRLLRRIDERDRASDAASIQHVLAARSVAVIGAGRDPAGTGHRVLANLICYGFPGPIHPVNPHAGELLGLPVLADAADLPPGVDLAVIATPAPTVVQVARACAGRGVKALVVISAGFGETGAANGEAELRAVCRDAGMRLVGPNCLGVLNTNNALNATFLAVSPSPGRVGVGAQSGAVGAVLMTELDRLGPGISSFVSLGNKADVSGNDLLLYWQNDPATDVIALYLESFGNPRKFARIARRISRHKPIVVVKAGRSAAGTRAVGSHTAAAASPDIAVDALLRRAGVIRAADLHELIDVVRLLGQQPLPRGRRVAIVGNSGGPGALAADACERAGLEVPELPKALQAELRDLLGPAAAVTNPVDLTADGTAGRYTDALRRTLDCPGIDAVIAVYTPPFGSGRRPTTDAIAAAAAGASKPVLGCILGSDDRLTPISTPQPTTVSNDSDTRSVPAYAYPEQAVTALAHVMRYAEGLTTEDPSVEEPAGDVEQGRRLVEAELTHAPAGRWLDPATAERLLGHYGIEPVRTLTATDPETAAKAAAELGFPVALKAAGPVHKSDLGGVRLNLTTPDEVSAAYRTMTDALGDQMTGAIVQPMIRDGVEVIIGATEQQSFGPLVMFAMGGVATELLSDRTFTAAPLTRADAATMVRGLRCSPLFTGYRGRPAVDVPALEDLLVRIGRLVEDLPEIAELDLNPVMASPDGAAIVDIKIRLAPAPAVPSPLLRTLG
jgi:acyl-CoA synthetase (NDP forming)/GNAT superfamily N-acetyltransferase